jgi:hypothetical protein
MKNELKRERLDMYGKMISHCIILEKLVEVAIDTVYKVEDIELDCFVTKFFLLLSLLQPEIERE